LSTINADDGNAGAGAGADVVHYEQWW